MRLHRRRLLVIAALAAGLALLVLFDLLGAVATVRSWLLVQPPADGSVGELLASAAARRARVDRLLALRRHGHVLTLAAVAVGLGAGLLAGGVGTYLYQRRRIRRGEWRE